MPCETLIGMYRIVGLKKKNHLSAVDFMITEVFLNSQHRARTHRSLLNVSTSLLQILLKLVSQAAWSCAAYKAITIWILKFLGICETADKNCCKYVNKVLSHPKFKMPHVGATQPIPNAEMKP